MNFTLDGLFGKIAPGMCRLTMNGNIAVKTATGFVSYNPKTNKLVNCSNFVFDIGEDFFFVLPTNKVEKNDIILVKGKPRCVIEPGKDKIVVLNYEDSTIETILPERHVFMGNTYFYGKIVSMFGDSLFKDKKKGANSVMKYMMMSEFMKGNGGGNNNLLPLMMMGGNGLGDMFNFDLDDCDDDKEEGDEQ